MERDTAQLAVITPDRAMNEEPSRNGWFNRPPKKHRIQDENARLKRDLRYAQELNETLSLNLSNQVLETQAAEAEIVSLRDELEELRRQLRVAQDANVANTHAVDFRFPQRPIDGPEDQATMPVPQAILLAEDDETKPDAATMLLERVVPKRAELAVTTVVPLVHEDEEEIVNDTALVWNARTTSPGFPVTWGREVAQTLRTSQSTTGTYRVIPLAARGTEATDVPGMTT
jgi:hypothetical protein